LQNLKLLHDHQLNDRSVFSPTFLQYEYRDIIFEIIEMIKVEEKEDDLGLGKVFLDISGIRQMVNMKLFCYGIGKVKWINLY